LSSGIKEVRPIRLTYCKIKCVEYVKIPPHSGQDLREEINNRKCEERQSFCRKEQISSVDKSTRELKRDRLCYSLSRTLINESQRSGKDDLQCRWNNQINVLVSGKRIAAKNGS
jgi:hypothetical protein